MYKRIKKLSFYKRSLITLAFILLVLQIDFLCYVYQSLVLFDKNEIDNYLTNYVNKLETAINKNSLDDYTKLSKDKNKYEKNTNFNAGYKELIKNKKLTYKKTDKDNIFDIFVDDNKLFTLKLNDKETTTKLALFKITLWKVEELENYSKDGLYETNIYASSDYKVYVNDKEVENTELVEATKLEGFEDTYSITDLATINYYSIKGLSSKPTITVKDSKGNVVNTEIKDNAYYAINQTKYATYNEVKDKINGFNPLTVAEIWSHLLTNDAYLSEISPYLLKGTPMYTKAREWVTGRDHTFTSDHIVMTPPFSDEWVGNFTFYNDDTFTVEVRLTENIFLTRVSSKRAIKLHELFYFVKYEGQYRLVNMMSLGD